jgi:hypothetical protein
MKKIICQLSISLDGSSQRQKLELLSTRTFMCSCRIGRYYTDESNDRPAHSTAARL